MAVGQKGNSRPAGTEPAAGLLIRVRERGPGIKNLRAILDGRYDSTTGLGVGILGAKRLMDTFHVETTGHGTIIELGKSLPPNAPNSAERKSSACAAWTPSPPSPSPAKAPSQPRR